MSVLISPRIYFKGIYSWDPGLANNGSDLYDAANARVILPPGVALDQLKDFIINNDVGSWNYYGTHDCQFVAQRSAITGGCTNPAGTLITADSIVSKPVRLDGKLVDLDPASNWNSQIYFDTFRLGDNAVGLRAKRSHRMHSRWIGQRAFYPLPVAGAFGVVWQTTFDKADVSFTGAASSPLLTALQTAMNDNGVAGLMLRFSTYRTLYFQNGGSVDIEHDPNAMSQLVTDLHNRYRNGEMISNPAYSVTVGSIGVWRTGENPSVPAGRFLAGDVGLNPCVVEVDAPSKRLVVDFGHTIPEVNFQNDKADVGDLRLVVTQQGQTTTVATIAPASYSRTAYESTAGIIDISLAGHADPDIVSKVQSGHLSLLATQNGSDLRVLDENELTVQAALRDIYLDQGLSESVSLSVLDKGLPAPAGSQILVARYDRERTLITTAAGNPEILTVQPAGTATLNVVSDAPGFVNVQFYPFRANEPTPTPNQTLDISSGFFISVRVLPFDDLLEQQTSDAQLTWTFIYENILSPYDVLNPVMSRPDIDLPLSDRTVMTSAPAITAIRAAIAKTNFESSRYMPVTRELSAGKRKLLQRWCDLVASGNLPEESNTLFNPPVSTRLFPFPKRSMKREI